MRFLISNDDGVNAIGLKHLVGALSNLGQVTVVAPDRDRSGASNSLTIDEPLRLNQLENGYISVMGTPTDCVHLAITGLIEGKPDMVVSGINAGANLGDDVLYSGTVAAAMEGRFMGFPAMAISLVSKQENYRYFETAAQVAHTLIQNILKTPLPIDTILNVNVPDLPHDELKGISITRLGHRHCAESVIEDRDPRGRQIFWVGPAGSEQDGGPGTDFHAISQGYVSITPLKFDMTKHEGLQPLKEWLEICSK